MRSSLFYPLAVISLLSLALSRTARADQDYLPTDLFPQLPACSRECINNLVHSEFQPFVCGPAPTARCFCSNYQNAGPSFGDIASYCITNYCGSPNDVSYSPFYGLCDASQLGSQTDTGTTMSGSSASYSAPLTTTTPAAIAAAVPSSTSTQDPSQTTSDSVVQTTQSQASQTQVTSQASSQTTFDFIVQTTKPGPSQTQATSSEATSLPADYSTLNPGQIAAIAVGTVVGAIVILVLGGVMISCLLSRRARSHSRSYIGGDRYPQESRFASSSNFVSHGLVKAAYEKHVEEGLRPGMRVQGHRPEAPKVLDKTLDTGRPLYSVTQFGTLNTSLPNIYSSGSKSPTKPRVSEHNSGIALPKISHAPRHAPQTFVAGQSALRPHKESNTLIKAPKSSTRSKTIQLRLHIPDSNGKTIPQIVKSIPLADTTGSGLSGVVGDRRSRRYSVGPDSPAPTAPPPPVPTGVRRSSRPDYMPSYYSKTRQQQLATPTSIVFADVSAAGSREGEDLGRPMVPPPTSFNRDRIATGFAGGVGEGVMMNSIKKDIRRHESTTSTEFDSDSSLTPLDDDSPVRAMAHVRNTSASAAHAIASTTKEPSASQTLYSSTRQASSQPLRSPISNFRYPDVPPRHSPQVTSTPRSGPAEPRTPRHQNAEAQLLLGLPSPRMPLPLYHGMGRTQQR